MTLLNYVKGLWTALLPAATKAKMENIEDGIKAASDVLDLETDAGRALTQAADAEAQRSALGLGDSATLNVGTGAGDVAAGNAPAAAQAAAEATAAGALAGHVSALDPHTQYAKEADLGDSASKNVGTGAGDVAAGNAPAAAQAAAEATAAGALAGHVSALDPHTQYAKEADLGDSASKNVGTGAGDVAAGNAPAGAVTTHESTYAHANLPTAAGKTAADAIGAATGASTALKLANLASPASETQQGVLAIASRSEATAGTNDTKAITPLKFAQALEAGQIITTTLAVDGGFAATNFGSTEAISGGTANG